MTWPSAKSARKPRQRLPWWRWMTPTGWTVLAGIALLATVLLVFQILGMIKF